MLLTTLPGCAHRAADPSPAPAIVTVKVKDVAPAELTRCPERPEGFPADATAVVGDPVRAAIIRLAQSYAAVIGQLERLIEWNAPGSCSRESRP
jgi:hypothetical protein